MSRLEPGSAARAEAEQDGPGTDPDVAVWLRAAVSGIEPSPDSLNRIRERLSTPAPAPLAWLMVFWSGVLSRAVARYEMANVPTALAWLRGRADGRNAAAPPPGTPPDHAPCQAGLSAAPGRGPYLPDRLGP